ncbi:hypothetical protein FN846DRAFT_921107 [Sphaerosporella brunnea]|uniref:Uncharacterized protein n=1 Tax=Sphaerosporella brunnea TaxID=1250544 RepID=A0A5J5ER61_9PEZI|nr:hypothetical protein FN846DRAFT_921107 [Sphaerosporella brunnea]
MLGGSDEPPYRTYVADLSHVLRDIHRVTKFVPTIPSDLEVEHDPLFEHCVVVSHAVFTSGFPVIRSLRAPHLLDRENVVSFNYMVFCVGRIPDPLITLDQMALSDIDHQTNGRMEEYESVRA